MNQNKISFCKALTDIRNRVVKSDGFLSGGSKCKFDVSDIDVTKAWRSMRGLADNETAKAALAVLTTDAGLSKAATILCMNMSDSNEAVASKLSSRCSFDQGSALLVTRVARANGLDLSKVICYLHEKSCGTYAVRGIPFGPEMDRRVSDACMMTVRADCDSAVSDLDNASVLDILTMANMASTPKEVSRAVDALQKLDPSVRSNGTVKSVRGHVNRIAHKYWFQRGLCPEFMKEKIARLIVKVANATVVSDEDYFHMEWLFRSASIMSSMYFSCNCEMGFKQVSDAVRLKREFDQAMDAHADAYISLTFTERFGDDFGEVSAAFSPAEIYLKAASVGCDADDVNSVIVNQPVTMKVGRNSTVHTGKKLASQGSLFDIIADNEGEVSGSLFDELNK